MSLKSRALLAAIRAVGKKKLPKTQIIINRIKAKKQQYESFKKKGPRIQAKTDIKYKFKQKPKIGGGADDTSLRTATHYGPGGKEFKVGSHAKRAIWHDTRARGSESWRAEMSRVFGGEHMAQSGIGLKRSLKKLHKQIAKDIKKFKKKKIKKVTEGGEVVIHDNVDRSLL